MRDVEGMLLRHAQALYAPWDSYMEENILKNQMVAIHAEGELIGYANLNGEQLFSFYVAQAFYRFAPQILAQLISEYGIKSAQVLTNDPLSAALIMEWDCELIDYGACFFVDALRLDMPNVRAEQPVFREATVEDIDRIVSATGDFFDKLAHRIAERTIFLLEDGGELMGCGIVEVGAVCADCVSIGMITRKDHRRKGVAQRMLWHLKEWAYAHGLRPIAGCWYYNVLSRKSLEAAGMIATGKGYSVALKEKKPLPLRTGNPPGELV